MNKNKKCPICGKEFTPKTKLQKYCSTKHKIKCSVCGKDFNKESRSLIGQTFHVCNNEKCKLEKRKRTNLEKYGVENPIQLEEIRKKMEQTNVEKYGFKYPLQNKEILNKLKETNLKRYGFETSLQNEEVKEKSKKTNLERYGVESVFLLEENKEKRRQVMLDKYGVEYTFQRPDIQEKIIETNLKRYGVERTLQIPEQRKKMQASFFSTYGMKYIDEYMDLERTLSKKYKDSIFWSKYFNVDIQTFRKIVKKNKLEYMVENFYSSSGPESEFVYLLEENGIKDDLYIRNDRSIIKPFELDFYFPKYKLAILNDEYEIINSLDVILDNAFKNKSYNEVIAFTDNNLKSGNIYNKCGFKIIEQNIENLVWYSYKYNKKISDYHLKKLGANKILKDFSKNYVNSNLKDKDIILSYGFLPVYDCGYTIWSKEL